MDLDQERFNRLEILSTSGMSHLNLQFNGTAIKKNKEVYDTLTLLLFNALKKKYKKKGLADFDDENFYKISFTDNWVGFHLSVQWEHAYDAEMALAIVKQAFEYVLSFEVENNTFENDDMKAMVESNLEGAQAIAREYMKDIFEEKEYKFEKEYWSPFD